MENTLGTTATDLRRSLCRQRLNRPISSPLVSRHVHETSKKHHFQCINLHGNVQPVSFAIVLNRMPLNERSIIRLRLRFGAHCGSKLAPTTVDVSMASDRFIDTWDSCESLQYLDITGSGFASWPRNLISRIVSHLRLRVCA